MDNLMGEEGWKRRRNGGIVSARERIGGSRASGQSFIHGTIIL